MPVTSYAPEFLELYRHAAQETVRIALPTKTAAMNLRAQLHKLRRDMRTENHPWATIANGVQISIEGSVLVAAPTGNVFLDAIRDAGIVVEDVSEAPAPVEEPGTAKAGPVYTDAAASAMRDIIRGRDEDKT